MTKSWPDVRYHRTQDMVCEASHGRPWLSRIERNRETPTQAFNVVPDINVTLPASEIGRYDSYT